MVIISTSIDPTINSNSNQDSKITEIRFGTSFGNCSGYCIQEVLFKEGVVEKTLIPHRDKSLKPARCQVEYGGFHDLSKKVNLSKFKELEVTIGCPDCADGGAEWVQIFTLDGLHKKVTYHYSKEPEAIKPFIAELREYYELIGVCE